MTQYIIVGVIVAAALLYSVWMLMPAAARRAGAARVASLASRCGLGERQAQRLHVTLATHSSCGECETCKGCASALENRTAALQQAAKSAPDRPHRN